MANRVLNAALMKVFFAALCLVVCGVSMAADAHGGRAETGQEIAQESVEALKARVAELEGYLDSLRAENKRLRVNLRKVRTELNDLKNSGNFPSKGKIGQAEAEKIVEEDLNKHAKDVPVSKEEQSFWGWFTQ